MTTATDRIQVTVIGGYLGSGKTTLVNHLLAEADERIAVLVNDFGEINVDLDLIEKRTDDTIELSNGCICCSMIDGFSAALDRIVALDPRPARLVIETSGVADPSTVAAYGHGPGLALDAVIVLVDLETIRASADDKYVGQTVRQQLEAAEVLVANKADLVDEATQVETMQWLRDVCPDAFFLTTSHSRIAPEVLFGRPSTASFGNASHHHPEQVFESRVEEVAEPVTRDWVDAFMAGLGDDVVRAKGLVCLQEAPETPFVLQRVGKQWTLRRSPVGWPGVPATRIVVIGVR